ncbi:hypothetical protein D3C80_1408520 [compost metagenome]
MQQSAIRGGAKAGESGIFPAQHLAERFLATLANFWLQQTQPGHAKLLLVLIYTQSDAARFVHMQQ